MGRAGRVGQSHGIGQGWAGGEWVGGAGGFAGWVGVVLGVKQGQSFLQGSIIRI